MPSVKLDSAFSDTAHPLTWWHVKVVIEKKHLWQQNIIRSCGARLKHYDDNGKVCAEYALMWRTSKGPQKFIDLQTTESPATLIVAARQTSGNDMLVNPDPINLPGFNLPSHSAILTDEIAILERRFSILSSEKAHPLEIELFRDGKPLKIARFFWLYVPAPKYDNEQFRLMTVPSKKENLRRLV